MAQVSPDVQGAATLAWAWAMISSITAVLASAEF
jgi:hypothetical protein